MTSSDDLPHGRYTRGRDGLGDATWTILRSLDVPLQWYILHHFSSPASRNDTTFLQLSPYNSIVLGMAFVNSARHIFWKLHTGEQVFTPGFAVLVSIFNTVNNALNVGAALWSGTSMAPEAGEGVLSSPTRVLGLALFSIGSFIETYSELGRKSFKADPKNEGKLYTGGLFGLARHVNFGGYLLWRTGFATWCGGLRWGSFVAVYFLYYFASAGIPPLANYLEQRVSSPSHFVLVLRADWLAVWCCLGGV